MFCGKCGKQIEDNAKFCPYCGAVSGRGAAGTGTGAAPVQKIQPAVPERGQQPEQKPGNASETAKGKSGKSKTGQVIGAIVCIGVIAVGAWKFGPVLLAETEMEETVALEESMEDETVADGLMEAEEEPTEAYAESETLVEETEETEELEETEEPEETEMLADDETPPRVFGTLNDDYILPECTTRYYTVEELRNISPDELRIAKNEIYARHGRMFKDQALNDYFRSKSWYRPVYTPEQFDAMGDSVFNSCELANRDVLLVLEQVVGE